jgi:hypothetical protein
MAKCSICGTDTPQFVNNTAVCDVCDDNLAERIAAMRAEEKDHRLENPEKAASSQLFASKVRNTFFSVTLADVDGRRPAVHPMTQGLYQQWTLVLVDKVTR